MEMQGTATQNQQKKPQEKQKNVLIKKKKKLNDKHISRLCILKVLPVLSFL